MLAEGVAFAQIVRAIHIIAVVIAFGVLFAYPLFALAGARSDPRAMPWFHRVQVRVIRFLVNPGLAVVLLAGIYLASDLHEWKRFFVQWGIGAVVVIGAIAGSLLAPTERKLAGLAERDVAQAGDGEVTFGADYLELQRRATIGTALVALIVLATIVLMAANS